jgi:hypothetical protein
VDLDRNFAAASWRATHAPGYHPGAAPESEPEVRALVALIERVRPVRCVALQSPFRAALWAGAGQGLAEAMAALNGYEARADACDARPGSFAGKYGAEQTLEVVTLEIPFLEEDEAWQQNRAALRHAVDLPV